MQRSIKYFGLSISVALLGSSAIVRAAPITVYDSKGFEPANGFSTAAFGGDLYGQGNPEWVPDTFPPVDGGQGVPATVVSTGSPVVLPTDPYNESTGTANGALTQSIEMARASTSKDTRWAPYTYSAVSNPYTPVASGTPIIDIDWDMDVTSGGSNSLFGVELNDGPGVGGRISYVAVDSSGNVDKDAAGAFTPTGTTVSLNAWNHYELQANFQSQNFSVFVNGILAGTGLFEDTQSAFTDASLVSYGSSALANPGGTGTAYYDNYVITAVAPEPTAGASVLAGCGLLLLRRRRGDI